MALDTEVVYRYFLTDLLTNTLIAEVPFKSVSYERVNRRAGGFSGSIPFIETTKGLDLYESTMPGRTGLYVMRNGVCVWGGIIWSRSYDVISKTMQVDGAEFTSYFYHRNIWQTLQYGSEFIGVATYNVTNGTAEIVTEIAHGFRVGQMVRITFVNPIVDGTHEITAVNAANRFSFRTTSANGSGSSTSGAVRSLVDMYDFARDLVFRMSTDLGGLNFANEAIKPGIETQTSVISKQRSANLVTLRTSTDHKVVPGQEIDVVEVDSQLNGYQTVTAVPDKRTIQFELVGPDIALTSLPGIRKINVLQKQLIDGIVTLTLEVPHQASVGQTVVLEGVDAFFSGVSDPTFNGRYTILSVPSSTSFSYAAGAILNTPPTTVAGGTASFGSKILSGEFGSFTANSDIGIELYDDFSEEKSGFYQNTQIIRGFENKTVGEILEAYSNTVSGGFEYRIDCDYDYDTAQFTRTFTIIPMDLPEPPPSGDIYPVGSFGADKLVFEYPGNILSFTVEESAEESATRFFVIGKIGDLNEEISQPYAAAADINMLNNTKGRSWPILDQAETLDNVDNEAQLYEYAQDYLYESRPPIGTYNLSVNGSMAPVVGSYFPGDWCSIIIDDAFVRERLANDQELRDDILVRRINSIKVNVPDSPSFPETVELELVTDWKVDKVGD